MKKKEILLDEAAEAYGKFLEAMGLDWRNDPNMEDTPRRVVKSFHNDLWSGLYFPEPKITSFDNVDKYDGIVFSGEIVVNSMCSHHNLPFIGYAYLAYIPSPDGSIIGLSKMNRICEYFSRRPQVQENLTNQIFDFLNEKTSGNNGVAVVIRAKHLCACVRGVKHNSYMVTSKLSGGFKDNESTKTEFYKFIDFNK